MIQEIMDDTINKSKDFVIFASPQMIDAIEEAVEKEINYLYTPNELQQKIIDLRIEGYSYKGIQLKLGNPSKQYIKDTLRKFRPDLAGDVVKNYNRLLPK